MNDRGCYRCGEIGHFSRQCQNFGGSTRNEYGRVRKAEFGSRDYSSRNNGGNFGYNRNTGKACYTCGEDGHFSRDCSQAPVAYDNKQACYSCGETGHLSYECPSYSAKDGRRNCFNCNRTGHISRNCPDERNIHCNSCNKIGHIQRDCPDSPPLVCHKCNETGHLARACPQLHAY